MNYKKILLLSFVMIISGCQSPKNIQPPQRPATASAKCMENAVSIVKKSRLAFNNSSSNWMKCVGARQLMRQAGREIENLAPCPQDFGPMAYNSFNSHYFALNTVNVQSCPINFQNNFMAYKNTWANLRELARPLPNMPLSNFHDVMIRGVPSNDFEEKILAQQRIISRVQPQLHIIYQKETSWCFDNADNRDIIHWRGCPNYR